MGKILRLGTSLFNGIVQIWVEDQWEKYLRSGTSLFHRMVQIWVEGQLESTSDQGIHYSMVGFKIGLKASGKDPQIRDHYSLVLF